MDKLLVDLVTSSEELEEQLESVHANNGRQTERIDDLGEQLDDLKDSFYGHDDDQV